MIASLCLKKCHDIIKHSSVHATHSHSQKHVNGDNLLNNDRMSAQREQ